jgi:two-component system NtrC family sensor kinase
MVLYHRDGTLIARHPHREDDIGRSFADSFLFSQRLPSAPAGTYVTSSGLFSFERVVSYRSMEGLPLVIAMNQSTRTILEPWSQAAFAASAALAGLALLLAVLVWLFLRLQRIRERSLQAEKLEALGHLTGSISHDFANLLNVVSASLRVIRHESAGQPRIGEAAASSERALLRGAQLLETLRTFARRQPMHVVPADLHRLIRAALDLLGQAAGPGVALQAELAAAEADCMLDETELEVALVNLLVNARDAGARRVVLRTFNRDGAVCLAVSDDGQGMAPEIRRRVFEPYFSTKGEQGTGLGLPQVYGFMHAVGGDVAIESRPGKGTAVILSFPKAPAGTRPGAVRASG